MSTLIGVSGCRSSEPSKRETIHDRAFVAQPWTDDIPDAPRLDGDMGGREVLVRDTKLFVIEEGEGVPLVLLNGGPGNSLHSFLPHFSRAADFARVVYYDPRGVGRSEWNPAEGYSCAQAIADLEALRDALDIERWVVLGWSWGGHLARLYALCHPERVQGLVLLSATAEFEVQQRVSAPELQSVDEAKRIRACYTYDGRRVLPVFANGVPAEHVQRMVYNAYRNGGWKHQHYYRPTDERIAQIVRYEWIHDQGYNFGLRKSGDIRLKGAFVGTPFPTLIVDGRWDMTFPLDKGKLLAEETEGGHAFLFEDSSHHVFSEEPGRFFGLLEAFMSKLPEPEAAKVEAFRQHAVPYVKQIQP